MAASGSLERCQTSEYRDRRPKSYQVAQVCGGAACRVGVTFNGSHSREREPGWPRPWNTGGGHRMGGHHGRAWWRGDQCDTPGRGSGIHRGIATVISSPVRSSGKWHVHADGVQVARLLPRCAWLTGIAMLQVSCRPGEPWQPRTAGRRPAPPFPGSAGRRAALRRGRLVPWMPGRLASSRPQRASSP